MKPEIPQEKLYKTIKSIMNSIIKTYRLLKVDDDNFKFLYKNGDTALEYYKTENNSQLLINPDLLNFIARMLSINTIYVGGNIWLWFEETFNVSPESWYYWFDNSEDEDEYLGQQ